VSQGLVSTIESSGILTVDVFTCPLEFEHFCDQRSRDVSRNTKVKHLGFVEQFFGNARFGEIGYDWFYLSGRHKIGDGVLDVSFSAVQPFPMDGVELGLGRLSDSAYKDGKD
jgi:hypothetical protein